MLMGLKAFILGGKGGREKGTSSFNTRATERKKILEEKKREKMHLKKKTRSQPIDLGGKGKIWLAEITGGEDTPRRR